MIEPWRLAPLSGLVPGGTDADAVDPFASHSYATGF